eukprot:1739872-Amphidinium_carterae.1
MVVRIPGQVYNVDRYVFDRSLTDVLGADVEMPNMKAALQAIVQILLQDKMWDTRKGRDILVFLPGTSEIPILATTIECLVKGGYITAVRVYKIKARVDQKTVNEMGKWPVAHTCYYPVNTPAEGYFQPVDSMEALCPDDPNLENTLCLSSGIRSVWFR